MKKNVFTYCFMLFASFALAQTNKGTFALGLHNFSPSGVLSNTTQLTPTNALGVGFGTYTFKNSRSPNDEVKSKFSYMGINANAHYFVIDNFSVGLGMNLFNQSEKEEDASSGDEYNITILMAGPELRYFINATPKSKVYVRGFASFGSADTDYGDDDDEGNKLNQFGSNLGMAYFPNQHFSVDFGLGYNIFNSKSERKDFNGNNVEYTYTSNSFILDLGFTVFF
jgi:long-subunit fatty acid transport protein